MRIWDIDPKKLCNKHLIAEHGELHVIWSVIVNNKKGFSYHPETKRWQGKLKALYARHEKLVKEMSRRGFNHCSALDKKQAKGQSKQDKFVNTIAEQKIILRNKKCGCFL